MPRKIVFTSLQTAELGLTYIEIVYWGLQKVNGSTGNKSHWLHDYSNIQRSLTKWVSQCFRYIVRNSKVIRHELWSQERHRIGLFLSLNKNSTDLVYHSFVPCYTLCLDASSYISVDFSIGLALWKSHCTIFCILVSAIADHQSRKRQICCA